MTGVGIMKSALTCFWACMWHHDTHRKGAGFASWHCDIACVTQNPFAPPYVDTTEYFFKLINPGFRCDCIPWSKHFSGDRAISWMQKNSKISLSLLGSSQQSFLVFLLSHQFVLPQKSFVFCFHNVRGLIKQSLAILSASGELALNEINSLSNQVF